jgi:2-methylisocitrate lyase-like PEP mutase family enzyme
MNPTLLAELATRLKKLHQPGDPLVVLNAWDAASATRIAAAGFPAVATSSAAVNESLGVPDNNSAPPAAVFDAARRIVQAVSVPGTLDLEAGYGLSAEEFIDCVLGTGAVGFNLEDTDYTSGATQATPLADPVAHAQRLADMRAVADRRRVAVVINARIDTFIRYRDRDPAAVLDETIQRARLYLEAGADCVYPIGVYQPDVAAKLVDTLQAPVNANIHPSVVLADLAKTGVARISVGPTAFRVLMGDLERRAKLLAGGDVAGFTA